MKFPLRLVALLLFAGSALANGLGIQPSFAAVTIQTKDGRTLTGEVDEQTNDQRLWIRQQTEQIILTSSVTWSEISSAIEGGEILPIAELPTLLRPQATSEPYGFHLRQVIYNAPVGLQGVDSRTQLTKPLRKLRLAKIRSLEVDAFLVNLDRDVEPDGIELTIAALDKHGLPVPVKGNLYVRLWGERIQPHGSLVRYEDLQQWNQPVVPVDFVEGLASYALRFQTVHPEFDYGLHSDALVHVRLGVYGQGNFAASMPVQIRSFNPVRDRLQLTRTGRFFPDELTQEVRHQFPRRTNTRPLRTR